MTAVQSWLNKGTNALPDWATPHLVGRRDPNGSVMITTLCGKERAQARCHVGHMLIERGGVAYTRHPSEAKGFLAELDDGEALVAAERAQRAASPAHNAKLIPAMVIEQELGSVRGQLASLESEKADLTAKAAALRSGKRFAAAKGMPPSIENRHPSELKIDDSYQRSIDTSPSRALISKIAASWDWRMCMPLVVSKRDDGSLYVIDGQHRQAAAVLRGDIPFLPCCVGVYAGIADEAAMFVAMNRSRRAINRLDDFHAAQAGGDDEALKVAALIEGAGFTVSRRTGSATWVPGEVAFTSAIAGVLRKHGEAIVRDALTAMAEAFPDQRLVAGSSVFTAISRVLISPPPDLDRDRLFRALLKFDMQGWADFLKGAKGGDDRAQKLREVLLMAYDEVSA